MTTTNDPRRVALDYVAALNEREAADFNAEARAESAEVRDFARKLFAGADDDDPRPRGLFAVRTR